MASAEAGAAVGVAAEVAAEGGGGEAAEGEVLESNHHSSVDSLPASSWGSPHTLHWRPTLRTSDCYRCTWEASAEAGEAVPESANLSNVPDTSCHHLGWSQRCL